MWPYNCLYIHFFLSFFFFTQIFFLTSLKSISIYYCKVTVQAFSYSIDIVQRLGLLPLIWVSQEKSQDTTNPYRSKTKNYNFYRILVLNIFFSAICYYYKKQSSRGALQKRHRITNRATVTREILSVSLRATAIGVLKSMPALRVKEEFLKTVYLPIFPNFRKSRPVSVTLEYS